MNSKKKTQYIIDGEHRLEIQGFRTSYLKAAFIWIGIIMSCGILWALLNWKRRYYMHYSYSKCSLKKAEKVLLTDNYNQDFVVKIISTMDSKQPRYFYFKKMKYAWKDNESTFMVVKGLKADKCSFFHNFAKGMSSTEAACSLEVYGSNFIHIQVKPVIRLILREVVSPFYIYQVFIVTVWFLQYYYQFGVCVIALSVISVAATAWETRKQSRSLRDAMKTETKVTVLRDSKEKEIPSEELVPGDVIILPHSCKTISCDCVLISGDCVVNESMLTGESIPITKVPVSEDDDSTFDVSSNKRSVLSCGTELLISRCSGNSPVKAVVYRTGFSTAKGELVRAILYPKPVRIKLHTDLLKCMVIFFILGIPALIYTGIVTNRLEAHPWDISLFLLNVVTFFVPPALPAVLTSINEQAQRRLRKEGIFCLNTRYINVAGGLDIVCFDKTGTLTEDKLDISDIVPSANGVFGAVLNHLGNAAPSLEKAFGCCHSLSNINGELTGYDLDIKMFNSIDWVLQEPTNKDSVPFDFLPPRIVFPKNQRFQFQEHGYVALVRQFPFESTFKRMSVVTKSERSHSFEVFVKGAPEIVASLCQNKTVPSDMQDILNSYSSKGFRIIAFASKMLNRNVDITQIRKMRREEFEKDMTFLGFLVLENKLKKGTIPSLNLLKEANIRLIMITGDNLLTAVTVSKNCGIVDENVPVILVEAKTIPDIYTNFNDKINVSYSYANHISSPNNKNGDVNLPMECEGMYNIAMEGETFNLLRTYDAQLLIKLVLRGAVFARMSPEQKLHLIEILQNLGYQVGMCGDGANDCGALKTAHTGVSLSMAEASVAAPFTATQQDISCISTLIREGRATLVSTFDAFRYMVCYTFMFLVAILMLLWDGQRPSDGAYVIIDVILNLSPPFLFGATGAYHKLVKNHPTRSVLSFIPLFSIISFMFFQICTIAIAYEYCLSQPWYVPFTFDKARAHFPEASHSGTTILMMNMMTYLTAAISFPTSKPYRANFFSNKLYLIVVIVQFLLVAFLFLYPPGFMVSYLNFKLAPTITYHMNLYAMSLGGMTFCFVWERVVIQRFLANYVIPKLKKRRAPKRKYEKLAKNLTDEEWHPMLPKGDGLSNEQSKLVCNVVLNAQLTERENDVSV